MKQTITVRARKELRSGTSDSGRDWTLWKLTATDAEGTEIPNVLKSFDTPPLDVPTEVELEPDDREDGAYLVRFRGGGGRSQQGLSERVDALEAKLDWAISKLRELDGGARPAPAPAGVAPVAEGAEYPELEKFSADPDDIPF